MKNTIKTLLVLLAVTLFMPSMPFGYQTAVLSAQATTVQTSLNGNITATQTNISVVSTTNFAASSGTVINQIAICDVMPAGCELATVQAIVAAGTNGTISVSRGVNQTRATSHQSGAVVFFGPAGRNPFVGRDLQPGGLCTATEWSILPLVVVNTGYVYHCRNSRWTRQDAGVTLVGDAAFTATLGDYIIAYSGPLTAARTITLPTPVTGMRGKMYILKNQTTFSTHSIWITPQIDGTRIQQLVSITSGFSPVVMIYTDGVNWFSIGSLFLQAPMQ